MDEYWVEPKSEVRLAERDPRDQRYFDLSKKEGKALLLKLNKELETLQELLWADGSHAVLIVLQGRDTAGKDGTIRHVFEGVNPQGVRVANFKVPSAAELAHDFLWRVHKQAPAKGEMVIFNRSHYEDVLVVRVHELVPPAVWSRRYRHINEFERLLVDEGVTILKFYLQISKEEQKERLQARLDEADKRWKFNPGDLKERALWDDYTAAYEAMLEKTSTSWAPWMVVPADRKWYRNLVIATTIVETLRKLNLQPPQPEANLDEIVIE